jgi:uncharacterized protein (DUF2141 family)
MPTLDWSALLSLLLLLADAGGVDAVLPPPAAPEGAIVAEVTGLRNDNGLVCCGLWNTEEGFPTKTTRALRYEFPKAQGRKAICRFEGYPPGTYAIVTYHDENSNHTLDQGLFGIPTEGYGASNDARSFMAPPHWGDAKFNYPGGILKIQMRMFY